MAVDVNYPLKSIDLTLKVGSQGPTGEVGSNGKSAYEIAVLNGFSGNEAEWLASLKGSKGDTGAIGPQGQQGIAGVSGPQGDKGDIGPIGPQGSKGDAGPAGSDGKSAYEIAVLGGYSGTQAEWLLSLKGEKGDTGPQGAQGEKGDTGPQGAQGEKGNTGAIGEPGESYEGYSIYRLSEDSYGVYTELDYKSGVILRRKVVLSGGTAPFYTTKTVTDYDASETQTRVRVYTISYDANSDIVSEVLQ